MPLFYGPKYVYTPQLNYIVFSRGVQYDCGMGFMRQTQYISDWGMAILQLLQVCLVQFMDGKCPFLLAVTSPEVVFFFKFFQKENQIKL